MPKVLSRLPILVVQVIDYQGLLRSGYGDVQELKLCAKLGKLPVDYISVLVQREQDFNFFVLFVDDCVESLTLLDFPRLLFLFEVVFLNIQAIKVQEVLFLLSLLDSCLRFNISEKQPLVSSYAIIEEVEQDNIFELQSLGLINS